MKLLPRTSLLPFLFSAVLFLAVVNQGASGEIGREDLIRNVLTAYGGEEQLKKVKSISIEGEVNALLKKKKGESRVYLKHPHQLRVETVLNGSRETLILQKERAWKSHNNAFIEVKGPSLDAVVFSLRTIFPPLEIVSRKNKTRYSGRQKLKGKAFETLEIDYKNRGKITLYIDPETFLIKRAKGLITVNRKTITLEKDYSDIKKTGLYLFPFSVISYADNRKNIEAKAKEVSFNKKIDEALFYHGSF